MKTEDQSSYDKHYARVALRSLMRSTLQAVIAERKRTQGFKMQVLADAIPVNKSLISRWFSGEAPNWRTDTISDIASALNVDVVDVRLRDRTTGQFFIASGPVKPSKPTQLSFTPSVAQPSSISSVPSYEEAGKYPRIIAA